MSIADSPIITRLRTLSPGWLLLLAALTLPFSNGRLSVAAVSWIAPIFLLRYTRLTTRPVRGFIAVWAVLFVVRWIAWFGLIPYPPPAFLVTSVLATLLTLLPLWIDRLLARRVPESVSTLVYPLAAVGIDFLVSVQSETTWTAIAYTQAGVLPVLQFASIFGLWGITFLIYWTAAVVNNLWDRAADRRTPVRSALVYLLVVSAVVLFGTIRLAWAPESSRDVRVIALNPPDLFKILSREQLTIFQRFFMKLEVDPMEVAPILEEIRRANRGLLALGAQAVVSGADYLVWPEGGLIAFGDAEEQELVGIARDLAQDGGLYLGIGIAVLRPGREELHENKILWIDPNGETVGEYHKTQLVPYVEDTVTRPGSGRVLVSDTAPARIGTVICYDMDNPRFLADAGREGVQILFAPSSDWDAIATVHHRMAVFRAVEQGFQLVRPANHGILAAVDSRGRVLASMRHDDPAGGALTATIPVSRSRTVYSRIGDGLPWLCLGLLSILAIAAAIRSR